MTGTASISMRPVTVAPSRIAGGGSVKPTLTSKVRVTGSACGATSRTRPLAVTDGSSVKLTVICGSLGAERISWAGTSNTASRPSWRASRTTICPAWTTSPGRGSDRRHHARRIGLELGEAHGVMRGLQLRLGGIDLRLRGLQRLLGLIVVRRAWSNPA